MRGGPEPVLVERVPADRERVVDPDRLAPDLRTIPVDRQVRGEVAGLATRQARCLEAQVLDQQQSRRPDRLDRERLPFRDHQALFVTKSRRDGSRDEEQDQAEVGQQRGHLRVLVPVAVEESTAILVGGLADTEAVAAQDRPQVHVRHTGHRGPIRQDRIEERLRLGDTHLGHAAPQPGRPIQRADDDR